MASLEYVRQRRPSIVIMENVSDSEAISAISSMVLAITFYTWHGGIIDTHRHCGLPMTRRRYFWVGTCARPTRIFLTLSPPPGHAPWSLRIASHSSFHPPP